MNDSTESQDERKKKEKQKAEFAPRMKQIVPGLFLGNVASSYNRGLLEKNHISAIVSLTKARCVFGAPPQKESSQQRLWQTVQTHQGLGINGFSAQTPRRKTFLFI